MVLSWRTKTDRLMARVAVTILSLGAIYILYSFSRPIWWRFKANVIKPFKDGGDSLI